MINFFQSPLLVKARLILGELAVGLLLSWWWLLCLELMRPGLVSLYLDLNLILIAAAVTWLLGTRPAPLRRPYAGPIIFGWLVAALGLTLAPNSAWLWVSLPIGLVAGLLWYVTQSVDLKD